MYTNIVHKFHKLILIQKNKENTQLSQTSQRRSHFSDLDVNVRISLSGFLTAVAVFRKPNAIPLCFFIDLVLNFLLSWVLVLLSPTFFFGRPLFLLAHGIQSGVHLHTQLINIILTFQIK